MRPVVLAASIVTFVLLSASTAVATEDLPALGWANGPFEATIYPSLDAGTHFNRLGMMLRDVGRFDYRGSSLGVGGFISGKAAASTIGIPGSGFTASFGFDGLAGFGPSTRAPAPWTDFRLRRSTEIRYEWLAYWDTWGTGQFSGRIEAVTALGNRSLGVAMQDDLFSPPFRDEYRTGAVEVSYGFPWQGVASALALGTKLWTGSTFGNGVYHRGQTIVMNTSLPGADDSAGVLYLAFRRGSIRLELGWDSEYIRNVFQNSVHWLINDGNVPLVDRPDRPYFLLSLYPDGDLY